MEKKDGTKRINNILFSMFTLFSLLGVICMLLGEVDVATLFFVLSIWTRV